MTEYYTCKICNQKATETYWLDRKRMYICAPCMRLYNPPFMTLIKFNQGSYHKLWNLEIGQYEEIDKVEELEWCGWTVRSTQETLYSLVPRVISFVYHMEFFGEHSCGRCVNYQYFDLDDPAKDCLSHACKKLAVPFKPTKDIQYPPERSRYTKWMKLQN